MQTKDESSAILPFQKLNLSAQPQPFLAAPNVPAAGGSSTNSDSIKKADILISAEFLLARRARDRGELRRAA